MPSKSRQKYNLLRNYGLISLISVTVSAIIIFLFFRVQAINTIEISNKASYSALAYAIADSLNDKFYEYFDEYENAIKQGRNAPPMYSELIRTFQRLISDTPVTRIKVYDHSGRVIFSTKKSQIGNFQSNNPGFVSAINGELATKLIYRDTLNFLDSEVEDANLIQSYVPIRKDNISKAIGVFEIYADVNELVVNASKTELIVLVFIILVMAGLYIVLIFYVKRAENIINEQQRKSKEKHKMLELLSAKMISAQEDEKKRISGELHENVVQTISAVKLYFEQCLYTVSSGQSKEPMAMPYHIIPILQDAIKKIRSVSIDLRPPSLDKFGLKAATNTLISEFNSMLSGIRIKVEIDISEEIITDDKKSIIYRILKDTLGLISLRKNLQGQIIVRLSFNQESGNLVLTIEIINQQPLSDYYDPNDFDLMRENTILSGGEFTVSRDSLGSIKALSEWESV